MFFPCDGANLTEKKTEQRGTAKNTNSLGYDSAKYATTSSGLTIPTEALTTTSTFLFDDDFLPLVSGKSSIFMYGGYFDFQAGDTTTNGGRVSISGDQGTDGSVWQPRWGNAMQHVLLDAQDPVGAPGDTISTGATYIAAAHGGLAETALIEAAVGVGGYFYKLAVYRPDGLIMKVHMCNGLTGATIGTYTGDTYGHAVFASDLTFTKAMKLAGVKATGILRLDFATIPANYLQLAFLNAAEWQRGNKIVLPYWE